MHAVRIHTPGGTDALTYEEVAVPEPGKEEVRVKVAAAGVNFIDTYHRAGLYPISTPFTPGMEVAGVVDAVGPGVFGVSEGQRVACGFHPGGYAEYTIIPANKLVHVPDGVDDQTAAALLLQGMTAHYLTHSTFLVQPGQTVLIHAAAGATGQLLVQMAKQHGARVFGTASTAAKAAQAVKAGADEVILYTQKDFVKEVKTLTDGQGVDVVYDSVGQATFEGSLDCLHPRGYMVLFGQSSGPVGQIDPQILNSKGSLFLTRPSLGHYVATREELDQRANDLFEAVQNGTLKVTIDRTLPLSEAGAAHEALESRATSGKLVLLP
jgi:NADPH2:quinone reductase